MHDPKLIEAMGNAYDLEEQAISVDEWNTDPAAARARCATAALTALCTLHPSVAAIISGEAVAVPRIATWEMCEAARDAGSDEESWGGIYDAFLSRSPFAQEPKA